MRFWRIVGSGRLCGRPRSWGMELMKQKKERGSVLKCKKVVGFSEVTKL